MHRTPIKASLLPGQSNIARKERHVFELAGGKPAKQFPLSSTLKVFGIIQNQYLHHVGVVRIK